MSGGTAMVENVAPERSLAQRLTALEHANAVRSWRAGLKVELKRGRPVVPLLTRPPAELSTMKVFDLLMAVPKAGQVKVGQVLRRCEISPRKTVGGLSPRQREALVLALRAWGSP